MFNVPVFESLTLPKASERQYLLGAQVTQLLLWLIFGFTALLVLLHLGEIFPLSNNAMLGFPLLVFATALIHRKLVELGRFKVIGPAVLLLLGLGLTTVLSTGYLSAPISPVFMLLLMANYRGRYRLLAPYLFLGVHASLIHLGHQPGAYEYQYRIFLLAAGMVYPLHLLFEVEHFDARLKAKLFRVTCYGVATSMFALAIIDRYALGSFATALQLLPAVLFAAAIGHFFEPFTKRAKNTPTVVVVATILLLVNAITANGMLTATLFPMALLQFFLLLSSFNALMLSLSLTLISILGLFTTAPTDFDLLPLAFRLIAAAAIFSLALKALFIYREIEAGLPTVPLSALIKVLPLSFAATVGVSVLLFDGFQPTQSAEFWAGEFDLHNAAEFLGLILTALLFIWGFGSFWLSSFDLDKLNQQSSKLLTELELALSAGGISVYELDVDSGTSTLLAGHHPVLKVGDQINAFEYADRVAIPADAEVIKKTLTNEKTECQFPARYQPNSKPRWSRLVTGSFYEVDGRLKNLYIRSDVTELQESLASMRLSNERQRDLFAVIGHELRTPVASVAMIVNDKAMSDQEKLSNITEISRGLLNILDDMRTVVAPERAKSAEYVVGNPSKVVERALTPLMTVLKERGFKAELAISSALDSTFRYREQALRQLVTNLVKNAALHSGGSTIWVEFSATQTETEVLSTTLSIEDDGTGIAEADLDKLFSAFGRGDTQSEGTGLGLFIARELARKLGGELSYQSSAHGGARFSLSFPLEASSADVNEPAQAPTLTTLDGMRILVAEDDGMLRMLTEKALTKQGARVTVTVDGAKALDAFSEGAFDLVLTDLMMPNMDGEALTCALREQGATLPIIAVTAAVIGEETDRLLEAGVDRVISKPISVEKLAQLLSELHEGNSNA